MRLRVGYFPPLAWYAGRSACVPIPPALAHLGRFLPIVKTQRHGRIQTYDTGARCACLRTLLLESLPDEGTPFTDSKPAWRPGRKGAGDERQPRPRFSVSGCPDARLYRSRLEDRSQPLDVGRPRRCPGGRARRPISKMRAFPACEHVGPRVESISLSP